MVGIGCPRCPAAAAAVLGAVAGPFDDLAAVGHRAQVGCVAAHQCRVKAGVSAEWWAWYPELLADSATGVSVDLAVAGQRRLLAVALPHVMGAAVTQAVGAVAFEPLFQLAAVHSAGCAPVAAQGGEGVCERLDDPRADGVEDPLVGGRFVREVVQGVEHVAPRFLV